VKKVIILSDAHLEHNVKPHRSYEVAKTFVKTEKPDILVLNGDMLDFSYLSTYNEAKAQLKEGKRLQKDIEMMKRELDFYNKYCKKLIYLEGNHEGRLSRRVETTPEYEGVLSLAKLLDLDIFVPEIEQPYRIDNSHLFAMHGKNFSIYYCANTLKQYGINLIVGHTHRVQTFTSRTYDKELGCWGLGCLCAMNPEYLNGKMPQWQNGIGVAYLHPNRNFTMNNLHMISNTFQWDGRTFK